jgi:hypothetical protein
VKEHPNNRFDVEGAVQDLRRKRLTQKIEAEKAEVEAAKTGAKDWADATPEEVTKFLRDHGIHRNL